MISNNTIKRYCKDDISKIENYEKAIADNTQTWCIHHQLETHKYKDRSRKEWVRRDEDIPPKELIALGLYFARPAAEFVFMTHSEHSSLHHKGKHQEISEEARRKISKANKGRTFSEEWKKKISKAMKGKPKSEEARKKLSEARKRENLSEETKCKMSAAKKGKTWKLIDGHRVWMEKENVNTTK